MVLFSMGTLGRFSQRRPDPAFFIVEPRQQKHHLQKDPLCANQGLQNRDHNYFTFLSSVRLVGFLKTTLTQYNLPLIR